MKRSTSVILGVLILVFALEVYAGDKDKTTMLFDRGLPTANLNDAAGASRSNVAWADGPYSAPDPTEYWLPGDNFKIAKPGIYGITTIRVWVVGDAGGLTLWGGPLGSAIAPISTSYSLTPVTYLDGSAYQGNSGLPSQIYQVDFAVDINLMGGQGFVFFVSGPWKLYNPSDPLSGYVNAFLHASNKLLSGSPQEGADDWFLWLHRKDGHNVAVETWNSGNGAGTAPPAWGSPNGFIGWDKASDANVQVFGHQGIGKGLNK